MQKHLIIFFFATLLAMAPRAPSAEELLMFEEHGCVWCARWNAEIAPIYPKTPEGQAAPLRRLDIHDPLPDDITLSRGAFYTPTFVLVRDGHELARIEGYPGQDFFWGLLDMMLKQNSVATGGTG